MAHPYTIGCFAIILTEEDKVLLCHRTDYDVWNLPGGGMERRELPTEAVIRETREETGLTVEIEKLVGIYGKPQKSELVMVFRCSVKGGALRLNSEADDLQFFPVDALPENLLPAHADRIQDAMKNLDEVIIRQQTIPAFR